MMTKPLLVSLHKSCTIRYMIKRLGGDANVIKLNRWDQCPNTGAWFNHLVYLKDPLRIDNYDKSKMRVKSL